MALSSDNNVLLRDIGINDDTAFDQFMASNDISSATTYQGLNMHTTGPIGGISAQFAANNASIDIANVNDGSLYGHQDGRMNNSTLPSKQTLLSGGPGTRPGLKLNVPSPSEPTVNNYHAYANMSQSNGNGMNVPLEMHPGINTGALGEEAFHLPGSLSPLSAVSSRPHSPGPYPPASAAPSPDPNSPYPHSPDHSSGGLSPAAHSPHHPNGSSPQTAPPPFPLEEENPPSSAGKLRGKNSFTKPRPNVSAAFNYNIQDPPQGYMSAGPHGQRGPFYPGQVATAAAGSKRGDTVETRFSRNRGHSVGSSGMGGHSRGPSGQMPDAGIRRGRVGTNSVGHSRATSPYPHQDPSRAGPMGSQDQGHSGLGLALSTANIAHLNSSFPSNSFVEIERAQSNIGSIDSHQEGGYNYSTGANGNSNEFVMDPSHSQHLLTIPSPSIHSPHHGPLSPHTPVSPIGIGSPTFQLPPETPQELLFTPVTSPVHAEFGQWSHHSSPAMRAGNVDGNGNGVAMPPGGPAEQIGMGTGLDLSFAFLTNPAQSTAFGQGQQFDPLPTGNTEFTGLGSSNSGTSGFPGSGGEGQFFAPSQQVAPQQQHQFNNAMASYGNGTYGDGSEQAVYNQMQMDAAAAASASSGYPPLTKDILDARFGADSMNSLAESERANSGIGNRDWEYSYGGNETQTQTINHNFIPGTANNDIPPGAHTPVPLMDTSSFVFNNNMGQQQVYGQTVPPSPQLNTLPWSDQPGGQLPTGNVDQYQQIQQQQQPQYPSPSQTQQPSLLHPHHAQSQATTIKRARPVRKRSHSASDAFPNHAQAPAPSSSYNPPSVFGQAMYSAPPDTNQFNPTGNQDVYLGGEGSSNLKGSRSLGVTNHRKALSTYDMPTITLTRADPHRIQYPMDDPLDQYQRQAQFTNGGQPIRPQGPVATQSSPGMMYGDANSFQHVSQTPSNGLPDPSFQQQAFSYPHPPQMHHSVTFPPPNPNPPLNMPHHHFQHDHSHVQTVSGIKPKQQGQRAEVDEAMLRKAFTSQSQHPDPGLRALLSVVRDCQFYLDEELEPAQGTQLAEEIFARVRQYVPNDPRFAYRGVGDGQAPGQPDGAAGARDTQSIYMLFTESNVCLICGKKTDRSTRALGHVRSDIGHRPFHCDCEKCSSSNNPRSFFSESLLDDHQKGQVVKQTCPICGNTFRRGGISRHMASKHVDHPDNPDRGKIYQMQDA